MGPSPRLLLTILIDRAMFYVVRGTLEEPEEE
jgi:hypothetical protein